MLGVVVWAAKAHNTAIVWCEDQGDLAFIEMQAHSAVAPDTFGAGDLIQFDLEVKKDMRMAQNPRRIAQHCCAGLDEVMSQVTALDANLPPKPPQVQTPQAQTPQAQKPLPDAHVPQDVPHAGDKPSGTVIDLSMRRRLRHRSVA